MPPKRYKLNETHGFIGDTKSKSKPREIDDTYFQEQVKLRERVFYKEARDKGDIAEMERIARRLRFVVPEKDKIKL